VKEISVDGELVKENNEKIKDCDIRRQWLTVCIAALKTQKDFSVVH
jgi:hypothetical protein